MSLFPEEYLTQPKKNELEITIFGPGYGESIVVYIPEIGWGIIDSCVTRFDGAAIVPPLAYLQSLLKPTYPKLAFIILTHPHEDHYGGLDRILKEYPGGVERVCRYNGNGITELKTYLIRHHRIGWTYVLPGLLNVFLAMDAAVRGGSHARNLAEMTVVFDKKNIKIGGYGSTDISMIALSPSAGSIQKYVEKLYKAIPVANRRIPIVEDDAHNLISVALFLKFGNIQVIFGSDLESGSGVSTGWIGVIKNKDCADLWANFVKVAHHGSENGFSAAAWEKHGSKCKPISIITPFSRGKIFLPKQDSIDKFKKLSSKVGITGAVNFVTNLHQYYPRDVVRSIGYKVRTMKVIEIPSQIGFIRTRFLPDGKMSECLTQSPARWI